MTIGREDVEHGCAIRLSAFIPKTLSAIHERQAGYKGSQPQSSGNGEDMTVRPPRYGSYDIFQYEYNCVDVDGILQVMDEGSCSRGNRANKLMLKGKSWKSN